MPQKKLIGSNLEAILSMPFQEAWMWLVDWKLGDNGFSTFVNQAPDAVGIVDVPRNHDFMVIRAELS